MRTYRFTVPGFPVGKQRPKFTTKAGSKFVHVYTPDKTVAYERMIGMCAKAAGVEMMEYVNVYVNVFIPPRVIHRKTMPDILKEPKKRPDIDNILKCCLDAMNNLAYKDDKNVLRAVIDLICVQRSEPHINIEVQETKFIIVENQPRIIPRGEES